MLTLDGWRESAGVQAKVRIAAALGKPVSYIDADEADEKTLVEAEA